MGEEDELYDSLSDLRVVDKPRPIWLNAALQHDPQSTGWKSEAAGSRSSNLARTYGGHGAHDRARPSRDSGGDNPGPGPPAASRSRRAPPALSTGAAGASDDPPMPKAAVSPTTTAHQEPHSLLLTFAGATAASSKPAGTASGAGGGPSAAAARRRNRAACIPSAGMSPRGHGVEPGGPGGGGGGYREQVKDSWDTLTHFTNRQVVAPSPAGPSVRAGRG